MSQDVNSDSQHNVITLLKSRVSHHGKSREEQDNTPTLMHHTEGQQPVGGMDNTHCQQPVFETPCS